jgi:hypothetical protein
MLLAMLVRLVAALAAAMIAAQLTALSGLGQPLGAWALVDAFFASSLAGAAAICLVVLRRRWWVLAIGVAFEAIFLFAFPWPPDFTQMIVQRGAGIGLVSLAALALERNREALFSALVLPLFVATTSVALDFTATLHPLTYDGVCLWLDSLLGQPSYVVGRWFGAFPPLGQLCATIYGELPLVCALVFVLERRRLGRWPTEIWAEFVAIGVFGYAIYHLFPVAGPRFAFPGWPGRVPAMTLERLTVVPVPRNCMPSLHTAWILLAALHTRHQPLWVKVGAAICVMGTLLATLGLGLHYAVDLIAAVPFLVAVLSLTRRFR